MKSIFRYGSILILISAGLIYFGCQKRSEHSIELGPGQIQATVSGRVTDNSNIPVEGATVKAGTATTTTDINGKFSIKDASLNKNAGFIKVEKNGFFIGSRTITVKANGTNYVDIQLIKKVSAGNFNSGSGGTVTVSNGGKINFEPAGIILADSKVAYSGTVSVDAFFISPTASNFKEIMPGALRGITSSNQSTGLQSFGMMAVELTGPGGQKLQLAQGKSATITFPIPAGLSAQAPATIPLWSFDETTGLWKEEGTATRIAGNYVGSVAHFSFWNCDAPFVTIDFKATIKDKSNKPIVGARVVIKKTGDEISLSGYGITNDEGEVGGLIPANENLQLQVFNSCGSLLTTKNIGPFAKDADIGTLSLDNPAPTKLTISGSVINCTGGTVANGFVNVTLEGSNYRASISKGNFSITIDRCDNSPVNAQIIAADLSNSQQGSIKNMTATSGNTNAGQLTACGTATNQYINFTVNSTDYNLLDPIDSLIGYRSTASTTIAGNTKSQNGNFIDFTFSPNVATGTTAINTLFVYVNRKSYSKYGSMNVSVTEYGAPGEYISGNLTGTVRQDSTSNPSTVPISCTFRVKRIQ